MMADSRAPVPCCPTLTDGATLPMETLADAVAVSVPSETVSETVYGVPAVAGAA